MADRVEAYVESFLELFGSSPWVRALAVVALSLLVAKIVDFILSRGIAVWTRRTRTNLDDRIIALLHRPVITSVLLIGAWLALLEIAPAVGVQLFLVRLLKTVAVLTWLSFLLKASSTVGKALMTMEGELSFLEPRTIVLMENVSWLVLVTGSAWALFLAWGIDLRPLLLSVGVIGIALGLAAKDSLANLFSGLFILADAPYEVGDFVVLDSGERGQISQIGLRSTRLLTRDDVEVTIPNAVIGNAKIVNESRGRWKKQRLRVKVGVAYGSDLDRVRELLLEVAREDPDIEDDPEPRVRFRQFGASSLDLELLGWIAEPVLRGRVLDALNMAVYRRFREEGIEIPFPKHDVYLHPAPGAEPPQV